MSQPSDSPLPATLDWYRQIANWIVGLAVGALALTPQWAGASTASTWPIRVLSIVTGLLLLIAVHSGIRLYIWLTDLGHCHERAHALSELTFDSEGSILEQAANHETEVSKTNQDMKNAERHVGFHWNWLLFVFPLAMLGLALLGLCRVVVPAPTQRYTVIKGSDSAATNAKPLLLYDAKTERLFTLSIEPGQGTVMREVHEDTTSVFSTLPDTTKN